MQAFCNKSNFKKLPIPPIIPVGEKPSKNFALKLIEFYKENQCREFLPSLTCKKLITQAKVLLQTLPSLLEIDLASDEDLVIVGDIHGQVFDLMNILHLFDDPDDNHKYVFNGDFVDRGCWGLETMMILLSLLLSHPGSVFLIRGNHEDDTINNMYGFREEMLDKYDPDLYNEVEELFKHLPVAALINNTIFVAHGGIGRGEFRMEDVRELDRVHASTVDGLLGDLLWSDPHPDDPGLSDNMRGVSVMWGQDITDLFLTNNKLELIVRSHECVMEGYTSTHNNKVVTVFSAPNYCDVMSNLGAVVIVQGSNVLSPVYRVFDYVAHPL